MSTLTLLLTLLLTPALAASPEALVSAAVPTLVDDADLTPADLDALVRHDDWRVRQRAALVVGWRAFPDLYAEHAGLQPRPTRMGALKFLGTSVADARLLPLYLERLVDGGEPEEVRVALADMLPRCGGDWEQAAVEVAAADASPLVRGMLVAALRDADDPTLALQGLRVGLADPHPHVRAEAARTIGWRSDGVALSEPLIAALADGDAGVRNASARALGWLRVPGAFAPLRPLLGDADARVRLRALRALERIDAPRAASLPDLDALTADADPKVRRAAAQVRAR